MKNIVLIGMPATGKSTVGVILAKRLGYSFLDADIMIAQREGRTLPQIIAEEGIERFLEIEGQTGLAISCESTVIATGGSMVFSDAAMAHLKENAITIWLETPLDALEARYARNSREDRGVAAPSDMTLEDIYNLRKPLYEKYADIILQCEEGTENVVRQIREAISDSLLFRPMRRKKQALSEEVNLSILKRNTAGVLSLLDTNGYTYGVPLSYVLIGNTIYFHGAKQGGKIEALRHHNQVSFTVVDQDLVVPEEYTTLYRSVIVFGRARIVTDPEEIGMSIRSLGRRYHPTGTEQLLEAEIAKDSHGLADRKSVV